MNPNIHDPSSAWNRCPDIWPELPLKVWKETYDSLHIWMQIAGKVRLQLSPHINHWWQVPFYVTSRGLSSSLIPYGIRTFEILFNFFDHRLTIETSDGEQKSMWLHAGPVSEFYSDFMDMLQLLDINVKIRPVPTEMPNPIPFYEDRIHRAYDPEYAHRFWRILMQTERVMKQFRSNFVGKCSPIHFFWGGFDLALTYFSGRVAPRHPPVPFTPDFVSVEAYSHEVSSCGFWPGGGPIQEPAFYAYTYPEPAEYKTSAVGPNASFYNEEMGEFILPYDSVRTAQNPDEELLTFLQTTYEAAAQSGRWDRKALERQQK